MDIQDIKKKIASKHAIEIPNLMMVRQVNQETGAEEGWVRHWENDARVAVVMPQDVFEKIKADPTRCDLALKSEVKTSKGDANTPGADYTMHIVIIPTSVEHVF